MYSSYPGLRPKRNEVPVNACGRFSPVGSVSCFENFTDFKEIPAVPQPVLPNSTPLPHCNLHWVREEEEDVAGTTGTVANRVEASAMAKFWLTCCSCNWALCWVYYENVLQFQLAFKQPSTNAEICRDKTQEFPWRRKEFAGLNHENVFSRCTASIFLNYSFIYIRKKLREIERENPELVHDSSTSSLKPKNGYSDDWCNTAGARCAPLLNGTMSSKALSKLLIQTDQLRQTTRLNYTF